MMSARQKRKIEDDCELSHLMKRMRVRDRCDGCRSAQEQAARLKIALREEKEKNDLLRRGMLVLYNKKMNEWRDWVLGNETADPPAPVPEWVQGRG